MCVHKGLLEMYLCGVKSKKIYLKEFLSLFQYFFESSFSPGSSDLETKCL